MNRYLSNILIGTGALSLAGCSVLNAGSNGAGGSKTASRFTVPSVISEQYVQGVLDELDKDQLPATVSADRSGHLSARALQITRSIFTGPAYRAQVDALSRPTGLAKESLRTHPAPVKSTVLKLVTRSPVCLFVKVLRDQSTEFKNGSAFTGYIVMIPYTPARNSSYNPTPWMIASESLSSAPNPCG